MGESTNNILEHVRPGLHRSTQINENVNTRQSIIDDAIMVAGSGDVVSIQEMEEKIPRLYVFPVMKLFDAYLFGKNDS